METLTVDGVRICYTQDSHRGREFLVATANVPRVPKEAVAVRALDGYVGDRDAYIAFCKRHLKDLLLSHTAPVRKAIARHDRRLERKR